MPQKSWAVGEEVLAADFNSYLQNQTVPQFTGTAQRDSQWASPPVGAVCVTTDTNSYWQRFTGLWYRPYTVQGYVERATDTGAFTAETSLAMDLTFTVPANRRVRLGVNLTGCNGTAGSQCWVSIKEGGTYIAQQRGTVSATTNWSNPFTPWRVVTPTAGAHTYTITAASSIAAGWLGAAPVTPMIFAAVDLGPV